MVNTSGTILHIAGTGSPGYSGDGKLAVSAALAYPQGLALDAAGNLYIADRANYRIRVVAVGGTITTYAGDGAFGDAGDNGPATSAELLDPVGVATDYQGDLYIADQIGVVRFVNASGIITTVSGNGGLPFSGDNGAAVLANFATPWGIGFDGSNNMYVADWKNSRVRKITPAGVITTFAGNGRLPDSGDGGQATSASVSPAALAVDPSSGIVYLADTGVVRAVNIASSTISTVAGSYNNAGGVNFGYSGDGGLAVNAELESYLPGLAVDSQHNIYIADYDNQRVRKVTASTGDIATIAGTGTAGYSGDGHAATAAQLQYPSGLAIDKNGNLYIADSGNCRVRMVSNGTITTVAGNGTCGTAGDSGAATSAEINYPVAVAVDGNLNLYIAQGNPAVNVGNTIRKVAAGTGIITTIAGNGTVGYSGDAGLATSAQLNNPQGLVVDSLGNVYVSDFGNSAVRVLQPETEPLLTVASTHTGSFPAGKTGTFDITVSNAALAAASSGTITVAATLFSGLTPSAMSGSGWSTCTLGSPTSSCQSSGSGTQGLGTITLTVNVPSGAPPQVTIQVTVMGGGAFATGSEDLALVGSSTPVLQISATHSGDFVAGAQGSFTITVGNQIGATDTSGQVDVSDTLPTGLSGLVLSSLSSSWNCSAVTSCNNNAPVAGGGNFPPITGTVTVASNAGSPLINTAKASGGSSLVSPTSNDSITVVSLTPCEVTGHSSVTVSDVQAIVNQGLGSSKAANDINLDGVVNVVDIQIVINAVLYSTCTP
jgi:uncharacterized repeat protein (TIGR01451 family)